MLQNTHVNEYLYNGRLYNTYFIKAVFRNRIFRPKLNSLNYYMHNVTYC